MAAQRRLAALSAAALTAMLIFAGGCGTREGGHSSGAQAEAASGQATPAPDFKLQSTQGDSLSLSSLRGKVVLVDFWATWCGPCRAEIPHLVELYAKYRSKGLEIVGIADDPRERDDVAPFVKQQQIPYPVVYGEPDVGPSFGGIIGYPTLFVVDKQGQVVKKIIGYTDIQNIEQWVTRLL